MQGMLNALAPVDTAAARQRGTRNALSEMKTRSAANSLNRERAVRQTGQEASQGGYSTEEHANALRGQGYAEAANRLTRQGQQVQSGKIGNVAKGLEVIARTAPLAKDQRSWERVKGFWEEKGLATAGELPDEFDPEVTRKLSGRAREQLSKSDLVEVQGPNGRPMFVPANMAPGMAPAGQQDFDQVNVALPGGERVRGRKGPGGSLQIIDDQGRWVEAPREAQRVGVNLSGSEEDVGLGETEQRKLRDQQTSAQNFIATTRDAINLLQENPNINTWAARAQSTLNSMAQEAKAIGLGGSNLKDSEKDPLDPKQWQETWGETGIDSDRLKGILQSLAFSLARSREGGRLSESDIRSALKTVGTSADPRSLSATMQDVANRVDRRFRINYETRTGEQYTGDLGLQSLPSFDSEGGQEGAGRIDQEDGIEVDDETRRLIEQYTGGQ